MKQMIYRELRRYNEYIALIDANDVMSKRNPRIPMTEKEKKLKCKKTVIECWLKLLSPDEYHVIRLHLIEKLDWGRVFVEYQKLWGEEFERSERTLQQYQANGVTKIATFALQWEPEMKKLFLDTEDYEIGDVI